MANTMSAVSLGRLLRSQTKQKVRQPLAECVLVSLDANVRADLTSMADVIAEELNVKKVTVESDEEQLVTLSAKPNLKKLGPRYGKQLGVISKLVAALTGKEITAAQISGSITLQGADGTAFELAADDIIINRTEKPGMTVANEGAVTVALDTRLTEELMLEGWAREVVSKLQNLRKESGMEVVDRIRIAYIAEGTIAQAIETQSEYICSETLALELAPAAAGDTEGFTTVELADKEAAFRIVKA
jgi:isoleucyl-tRNA synthetase